MYELLNGPLAAAGLVCRRCAAGSIFSTAVVRVINKFYRVRNMIRLFWPNDISDVWINFLTSAPNFREGGQLGQLTPWPSLTGLQFALATKPKMTCKDNYSSSCFDNLLHYNYFTSRPVVTSNVLSSARLPLRGATALLGGIKTDATCALLYTANFYTPWIGKLSC